MFILAVEDGKLPPTVLDEILDNVQPSDNKAATAKKVRKGNCRNRYR